MLSGLTVDAAEHISILTILNILLLHSCPLNTNLLLTKHGGHTGEYWPKVMPVRTECSEVLTKMAKGQYSPLRLELARLVSCLLYSTLTMLFFNLPAFQNTKYTTYDCFHGNGPYGEIPTKKEPIKMLKFTSRLPCHIIMVFIISISQILHNYAVTEQISKPYSTG